MIDKVLRTFGSRVLISGGAGSIGSELARQLSKKNRLYLLDIDEMRLHGVMNDFKVPGRVGDIRNRDTLRNVFDDFRPEVVFHAAAYKSVDMMEYVPQEAIDTNIQGTRNILDYAKIFSVKRLTFVSTDKVVNATSIMGETKKVGETMTLNEGYVAVRFGNVMGSRGSVLEIWDKQYKAGKPLTITHPDMMRYTMSPYEAVGLLIEAGKKGKGGELWIMDMGKPIKILELKELLYGDYPHEFMGIRPGEQIEEKLMTLEEEKKAVKKGKFYVISH